MCPSRRASRYLILILCQQELIIAARANKKSDTSEADKGVPLAPSAKDLNPWYVDKNRDLAGTGPQHNNVDDQDERK